MVKSRKSLDAAGLDNKLRNENVEGTMMEDMGGSLRSTLYW